MHIIRKLSNVSIFFQRNCLIDMVMYKLCSLKTKYTMFFNFVASHIMREYLEGGL